MKIQAIFLDGNENPERVRVEMSLGEAAYLARLTGKQSPVTANGIVDDGSHYNAAVYNSLTGNLFNKFYDGGVNDV